MRSKPLYVISIVSEMFDLHPQTLRQYERLGFINPQRTQGNTRLYSDEDLETLKFILTLTKDMGVNLAGVEVIINMKNQMEELQTQNEQLRRFIMEHADSINAKREGLVPVTENRIIKVKIDTE
ncbi:helix-turn-helix transcriptional regulator [Seleniivibrio sp.]|uniref:heat shock protein transcriptional repressor HspR n=1 Tax=Seleniivibrio sp. TaxID=2898801 RepID=UPI0025EA8A6C|nr:helix-turn-helix transcriptional regulator [Seleniivibrio sp.]MCD8553010.1 helix-turn-helix transcriptional regulator [Seleniivibrio sp.]